MIAKRTDSIWWRSAQQLECGFASLTTAPSARNYGNIYARSHPACEANGIRFHSGEKVSSIVTT